MSAENEISQDDLNLYETIADHDSDLALKENITDHDSDVALLETIADHDTDLANKQDLDSDLTAIAGLTPANDDIIQRKSGAWTNRTLAQLKTDLNFKFPDSYLVAHWNMSQLKTNIGTAFVNIYSQVNSNGKAVKIHTASFTQVRFLIDWSRTGAGTQSVQLVDVANASNVLISMTVVSGENDSGFVAIPSGLLNAEKSYVLQGKSTLGSDDPTFENCAVWLK